MVSNNRNNEITPATPVDSADRGSVISPRAGLICSPRGVDARGGVCSIADRIFGLVVADGGILHVWFNGAKFRVLKHERMVDFGTSTILFDPTDAESMEWVDVYEPKLELKQMIIRNIKEINELFQKYVKEWRNQNGLS